MYDPYMKEYGWNTTVLVCCPFVAQMKDQVGKTGVSAEFVGPSNDNFYQLNIVSSPRSWKLVKQTCMHGMMMMTLSKT